MKSLLSYLFPERCLACRKLIDDGGWLCPACLAKFPWLPPSHCSRCALPFVAEGTGVHECGDCLSLGGTVDRVFAFGLFQGILHEMVIRMKYRGEERLARRLGTEMGRGLEAFSYDCVVPVPLHVSRLRRRGYNQSAWLARSLAGLRGGTYAPFVLVRTRSSTPQMGLSREERTQNVRNSFAVVDEDIVGKRILLVDDVYTTGATLEACARVLKKKKAKGVDACVVARAV